MRPAELVPGNCYFSIGYRDHDLLFPAIQTLKYIGTEGDEDGRLLWTFQDLSSLRLSPEAGTDVDQSMYVFPEEQLHGIQDFTGLIRTLGDVALDHPLHPSPGDLGPATEADLGDLQERLQRFVQTPDIESVTITIRYTDDGLSFTRRLAQGTIHLLLFPQSRLNPAHESGLRAVCLAAGLTATEDYQANGGRTRVLVYPIHADKWLKVANVAARIFLDVYRMRCGDTLRYQFKSVTSRPVG